MKLKFELKKIHHDLKKQKKVYVSMETKAEKFNQRQPQNRNESNQTIYDVFMTNEFPIIK